MSIIATVYIPDGIIMAADSRMTGSKTRDGVMTVATVSDCIQKVILLNKNHVGISSCGDAILNGTSVSDYLRLFEINQVQDSDTVESTAKKLFNCIENAEFDSQFIVCGYNNDEPFVFDVSRSGYSRNNYEYTKNMVDYGAHWNGKIDAICRLLNSDPPTQILWSLMQLKDGIDLAEFIVDTTIKYERFMDDIQTCGGAIDILVITKDDAFWYQHKVFSQKK